MEKRIVVIEWWCDTPETEEIRDDAMLLVSPGLYYHYRLDTYILVKNDLNDAVARLL